MMLDDIFNDIFEAEEKPYMEGKEAGRIASKKSQQCEAFVLGVKKGSEVGCEIGFAAGAAFALQQHEIFLSRLAAENDVLPLFNSARVDPHLTISDRAHHTLMRLQTALDRLQPLLCDPSCEQLSETLSEVRARYKLLLAQTGLKNLNIFPVPVDYEVPREPRTSDSNEEVADSAVRVASHDRPTKVNIAAISF